jgi:hypothetical protein
MNWNFFSKKLKKLDKRTPTTRRAPGPSLCTNLQEGVTFLEKC